MDGIGHSRTKMVLCMPYPSLFYTQQNILLATQYFLSSLYIGEPEITKLKRNINATINTIDILKFLNNKFLTIFKKQYTFSFSSITRPYSTQNA